MRPWPHPGAGMPRARPKSSSASSAADHGVSEARYLRDPDENGVVLYWDGPMEEWPRTLESELAIFTKALDLDSLLAAKAWRAIAKVFNRSRHPPSNGGVSATGCLREAQFSIHTPR